MKIRITRAQADDRVQQLLGKAILFLRCSPEGWNVEIGLGSPLPPGKRWRKEDDPADYSICTYGGLAREQLGCNEPIRIYRPEEFTYLLNHPIVSAKVLPNKQLSLCVGLHSVVTTSHGDHLWWKLFQAETEEDSLFVYPSGFRVQTRLHRRWSSNFAGERKRWYPFHKFLGVPQDSLSVEKSSADAFLSQLVGMVVIRAEKSPDMNLFDFGFEGNEALKEHYPYILHALCAIQVDTEDEHSEIYYGDTSTEAFATVCAQLIGQKVENVHVIDGNDLMIWLERTAVRFLVADDGYESWRFFGKRTRHLVASDLTLNLL